MIVLQNAIVRPRTASGLRSSRADLPRPAAQFDLVFEFIPRDGSLNLAIAYNTDLFDTATVERMAGHLHVLLAAIAADPDQLVGRCRADPPGGDGRPRPAPDRPARSRRGTFAELFQAQAPARRRRRRWLAGPARLSYAELNTRANQLARHLTAAGAGPERLIALALPRTRRHDHRHPGRPQNRRRLPPPRPRLAPGRTATLLTDAKPALIITTSHRTPRRPLRPARARPGRASDRAPATTLAAARPTPTGHGR